MTAAEKFKIEHPELNMDRYCPSEFGYLPNPDTCSSIDCDQCWNREIPETSIADCMETAGSAAEKSIKPTKEFADAIEKYKIEHPEEQALEVTGVPDRYSDEPHILDSGERREFETGAVRDIQEGKGRCDLMPLDVVSEHMKDDTIDLISQFQREGNVQYLYSCLGIFSKNWDDGKTNRISQEIVNQRIATMYLETSKHFEEGAKKYGEYNWQKGIPVHCYIDSAVRHYLKWLRKDTDEPHDRAFVWNILCAIWTCDHKPELNDYYKGNK